MKKLSEKWFYRWLRVVHQELRSFTKIIYMEESQHVDMLILTDKAGETNDSVVLMAEWKEWCWLFWMALRVKKRYPFKLLVGKPPSAGKNLRRPFQKGARNRVFLSPLLPVIAEGKGVPGPAVLRGFIWICAYHPNQRFYSTRIPGVQGCSYWSGSPLL